MTTHEVFAYGLFYLAYLAFLAQVYDTDTRAAFAGTSGSPAAVGIVLHVVGQAVIYYVR